MRRATRQIRQMALLHLQESLVNNAAANIFERVLADKYPQHRKLFKVLSWVGAYRVRVVRVVYGVGKSLQAERAQSPARDSVRVPVEKLRIGESEKLQSS